MTLQEQLAKGVPAATGANPIVQSIAAMSGACTDWSYQMMKSFEVARVTITAEQDNWFNGCVANKLLPTCKMWPAEVYTYSASAKYDVCLSKGGESTLNDTTYVTRGFVTCILVAAITPTPTGLPPSRTSLSPSCRRSWR